MFLKIKNLRLSFPNQSIPILKNIDFHLNEGDFCVVIGPNGSGKSSFLKSIEGVYQAQFDELILNSQDLTKTSQMKRSKLLTSVSQDLSKSLVDELSLLENFVLHQRRGQKRRWQFFKSFQTSFEQFMDQDFLNFTTSPKKLVSELSGGQKQILATLFVMSSKLDLLLLDEHTSALDPQIQDLLMNWLSKEIKKQKLTTCMVTHNLSHALSFGNCLAIFQKGQLIRFVPKEEKHHLKQEDLTPFFL
jgi:putative ABC transport system ATP-binding protein